MIGKFHPAAAAIMDGLMILTSRVKVPILIEIFQPKVNVNIGNVKNKEF